jgi:hypothetical protein
MISGATQSCVRDYDSGAVRTWKKAEKLTENGEEAMMGKTEATVQVVDESVG